MSQIQGRIDGYSPQSNDIGLRIVACIPFVAIATLILIADCELSTYLCSWVEMIPGKDKTVHFFLFGGLAIPAALLFAKRQNRLTLKAIFRGALLVSGLATLDEFSQLFIAVRTFDWFDLACNYLGVAFFGCVIAFLNRR